MIHVLLLPVLLAGPAAAQEDVNTSAIDELPVAIPDAMPEEVRVVRSGGVILKGLDKVSGEVVDVELRVGETVTVGRVEVGLGECRYFEDNPAGEGFAWLTIRDSVRDAVVFDGWMVASSPALNALDHPRYDIWVIRCTTA